MGAFRGALIVRCERVSYRCPGPEGSFGARERARVVTGERQSVPETSLLEREVEPKLSGLNTLLLLLGQVGANRAGPVEAEPSSQAKLS